jgi:triacylglycerol lipase
MDLFEAGVEDRPGLRYQCVAAFAPARGATDWLAAMRSPWAALSATLFTALHQITARHDERYPCAPADGSARRRVRALLGVEPPASASDGIVPLYSQIWGELVWVGHADHLDIVGHFSGRASGHTDWLSSGAHFSQVRFDLAMDRIVDGMLEAEARRAIPARQSDAPLA